jgi:hypothetical protein
MRLLHPETIRIVATVCKDEDFSSATVSRKSVIAHAWSETLKYLATKQQHPKMWLTDSQLGAYLRVVKTYGDMVGCKLNQELLPKYEYVSYGYYNYAPKLKDASDIINANAKSFKFDSTYLFSDCVSLYFKGLNIFPYIYGDDWRRVVPVESLKEIHRQVSKTIEK